MKTIYEHINEANSYKLDKSEKDRLKNLFTDDYLNKVEKLIFNSDGTITAKKLSVYRYKTPQETAKRQALILKTQGFETEIIDAYEDKKDSPNKSYVVTTFKIIDYNHVESNGLFRLVDDYEYETIISKIKKLK